MNPPHQRPGRLSRRAVATSALALGANLALGRPLRASAQSTPALEIRRGDTSKQWVSLTFDAGADKGYTDLIVDTLAEHDVKASFGMTGVWAGQNPAQIQRIHAGGHEFMNHTWSHLSWTGNSTKSAPLSFWERKVEVVRLEEILNDLVGVNPKPLFRSPFGDLDASVLRDLGALGYTHNILWTVDSRGWLRIPAGELTRHCLANASAGAIYVMHVGAQSLDGPALAPIIEGLRGRGYTFATVSEILGLTPEAATD